MEESIERQETIGDYTIKVIYDIEPLNPRTDWDCHLGTMACFHRRYNLGDKHNLSIEEVKEIFESKDYISLPLFLYDHSGITMNTSGFSCPWDSGQVGIIYVSVERVKKEYGWKSLTIKRIEKIREYLEQEVKTYDDYLTGQCFGYIIEDSDGNSLESCWGFLGDANYCFEEAKRLIPCLKKQKAKEEAEHARISQPDFIQAS